MTVASFGILDFMTTRITITSEMIDQELIGSELRALRAEVGFAMRVEQSRSIGAGTLVALVGATGTALGALITGLLKLASERGAKQIILQGKSGRRVEMPVGLSKSEQQKLVDMARELDIDKITL
jgi:hypothetical protein